MRHGEPRRLAAGEKQDTSVSTFPSFLAFRVSGYRCSEYAGAMDTMWTWTLVNKPPLIGALILVRLKALRTDVG
jgi:hypothetical protein